MEERLTRVERGKQTQRSQHTRDREASNRGRSTQNWNMRGRKASTQARGANALGRGPANEAQGQTIQGRGKANTQGTHKRQKANTERRGAITGGREVSTTAERQYRRPRDEHVRTLTVG